MTLLILLKVKKSDLLPNRFEPERTRVEVENLTKGLVYEQKNIFHRKNMSWKHKLVHLLQNKSNNNDGMESLCCRERNDTPPPPPPFACLTTAD